MGGPERRYAVGIFLCPAAGVKSNRKNRFMADIPNRPRYRPFRDPSTRHGACNLSARRVNA
jgi:hypothetical protein